jgi:hypothetical protein
MKAHDPAHSVIISQGRVPQAFGEKPFTYEMSTATTGEDDTLDVEITFPPQPQVVWAIHRTIGSRNHFTSTLTNVLSGLYQKYGMPWNPNPPLPLNQSFQQWFFNDQGRPVNPTTQADIFAMKGCKNTVLQQWSIFGNTPHNVPGSGTAVQVNNSAPRNSIVKMPAAFDPTKNPQCNNLVYVQTEINGGNANQNDLRFAIQFWIYDYPLQHRTSIPFNEMLNAAVQRGIQQQQNDLSKAPLPKL